MAQRSQILVVEDEADIRNLMVLHLNREGYAVTSVETGEAALALTQKNSYDLAIIDWMLPGISGLDLCQKLNSKYPLLMVTARAENSDIVIGLTAGADDYITKPFDIAVFIARVRSLLRRNRSDSFSPQSIITLGQLVLNVETFDVTVDNVKIALTPLEFKLLHHLLRNQGKVLPRKQLLDFAQGEDISVTERTVDVHISSIRKKIGELSANIETIRGIGYRIKTEI